MSENNENGGLTQEQMVLMREAEGIDGQEAVHAEAAAEGRIDPRGQIIEHDPDARAMEWFLIPKAIAWGITTIYPETAAAYTDAKCLELARAIVPVADKYGLSGIGDSPELTLLMAAAFFGAPGYLAHQARKQEAEKARDADKGASDGG